jgi:hypothetical protein
MGISKRAIVTATLIFAIASLINSALAQGYNYAEVLQKSMWFYEVQRSGKMPDNNRVEWRASSGLKDGGDVGHDLTGGWLDAGDNMKFNFPMASSVTLLAWGALEFPAGYQKIGQWGWLLNNIKWATDYFIKCHTTSTELYGQVGQGMVDHKWWGSPEVFPNPRPAFKIDAQHPGSELAAEIAAALASSSILFRGTDASYADNLLNHAKAIYDFADRYRGLYSDAITDVTDFYKSWSGYHDELVWGAIWLYLATGESAYLAKAEAGYDSLPKEPQSTTPIFKEALSWDDKSYGCYVLLAKITNKAKYHTDAQRWLDWWSYGYSARQSGVTTWSSDQGIAYTPSGLSWIRSWGPIRYAANTAFAALAYSNCNDLPTQKKNLYYQWAKSQVDFALGNNELKRSYVCGFGVNPPVKPHHRSMHGAYLDDNGRTPANSRHVLFGALVGGPGQDGSYVDDRLDAVKNEVTTDYNAGFSSALARLVQDNGGSPLTNFPEAAQRDTEYTVVAKINTQGDRFSEISATVQNKTTWPARYSQKLTMRYYVDLSEVFSAGYKLSDVQVSFRACFVCNAAPKVSGLLPYSKIANMYYTEISFDPGDSIFPGGQSAFRREVQFRISLPDTAPQHLWDPSNDPSFKGLTTMADTNGFANIPAYENGVLVWGREPDGTSFVPAKWNKPSLPEPQYSPSAWNGSLFKGASLATEPLPSFETRSETELCKMIRNEKWISVQALEDINIGIFSINGKELQACKIGKGMRRNIDLARFPTECLLVRISGKRASTVNKYISDR